MKAENIALDTGVFTLYYIDERQGKDTLESIFRGDLMGHTCELNLAEYYYKTCENAGREIAEITQRAIRTKPIHVHSPEQDLSMIAASLKCDYRGKISLVDSYILAVSKKHDCRLITTDPVLKEINVVPTTLLEVPKSKLAKKPR
ncbi:MAG TPA: PIN domain-containing protein [Nitrososphaerales archaeon]|nr:PIN domain-containing protein [Nitrososphaerales archaeon]